LKFNANEEIGNQYFKKYNCQGVPHLLFLNSDGEEIDRIIGFLSPSEYLLRIEDIAKQRNTLNDYLERYNNGEIDMDIIAGIAMKYQSRKEDDKAAEFYSILVKNYPDTSSQYYKQGKYFLAYNEFKSGNEDAMKTYFLENPNSPFHFEAYRQMTFYYANSEQRAKEIATYKEMLAKFPNDPNALNSYAWRMAEIEVNLEHALEIAKQAVVLTQDEPGRQANIIDTEAEVLWKLNRFDDAIDAIERAIKIEPDNQYFRDQKEKFNNYNREVIQPI